MTIKIADRTGRWLQHACMLAKINNHAKIQAPHFYRAALEDMEFFAGLDEQYPETIDILKGFLDAQLFDIPSEDHEADPELSEEIIDVYNILMMERLPSRMAVSAEALLEEMLVHHPIEADPHAAVLAIYSLRRLEALADKQKNIKEIKQDFSPKNLINFQPAPVKAEPKTFTGSLARQIPFLREDLAEEIFGQDHALDAVVETLMISAAGFERENKTAGSFMFHGPSGVGKTELAREVAKKLGIPLLKYDMSEYKESHTVSRLIGSPPGYIGSDKGGCLVNDVIKSPCAVVLFDEIEKAHRDVYDLLLQVMDDGKLTDREGQVAEFGNIIFIASSNVGQANAKKESIGFGAQTEAAEEINEEIKRLFRPELRNRFDASIRFNDIKGEVMPKIVNKFVSGFIEELEQKSIRASFSKAATGYLIKAGLESEFGPRDIKRAIERQVKSKVAAKLLIGELSAGDEVLVDYDSGKAALRTIFINAYSHSGQTDPLPSSLTAGLDLPMPKKDGRNHGLAPA